MLTDQRIEELRHQTFSTSNPFCPVDSKSMRKAARAVEAEVRKQDTDLIRQMLAALENHDGNYKLSKSAGAAVDAAIDAAHARLENT